MECQGVVVPMVTPATGRHGGVDEDALEAYTAQLVEGGVHALFPCGSIGEFASLTPDQRERVVETVVSASGDVPVLAGCGDTAVDSVVDHVERAAAAGADAAVVVTPYYLGSSQGGLREFYEVVADAAALPVVLYTIPPLTGEHLAVETVADLAEHPNVVGVKDSSRNLRYHSRLIAETPASFAVLQGATELAVPALDLGADGAVAGPANYQPRVLSDAYRAYRDGDRERAVELMNEVVDPVLRISEDIPTAAAMKYLVSLDGPDVGVPFPPVPQLDDDQRRRLREQFRRVSDASDRLD